MFEPLYLHVTEEVGPRDGIWLGTECLLLSGASTPAHRLPHLCQYPDVLLYIFLFCFRVARILELCLLSVSAVLCLPACLLFRRSVPRGRAPHGNASVLWWSPSARAVVVR